MMRLLLMFQSIFHLIQESHRLQHPGKQQKRIDREKIKTQKIPTKQILVPIEPFRLKQE